MGNSNLDRIKSQYPNMSRSEQRELASQLDEMEYRTRIVNEGSRQESTRVSQTSSDLARMYDAVGRAVDSLPPAKRQELEGQAQTVLDHSFAHLNAAHEETMRQIHSAPLRKQGSGSDFVDGFLDELRSNFFGD